MWKCIACLSTRLKYGINRYITSRINYVVTATCSNASACCTYKQMLNNGGIDCEFFRGGGLVDLTFIPFYLIS